MKRGKKNILKDQLTRLYYIKFELKRLILKSIIQNKNTKPIIRGFALYKKTYLYKKGSIAKQNSICILRGRSRGVWKFSQLSRHAMIKLGVYGGLQNTKIKSW